MILKRHIKMLTSMECPHGAVEAHRTSNAVVAGSNPAEDVFAASKTDAQRVDASACNPHDKKSIY